MNGIMFSLPLLLIPGSVYPRISLYILGFILVSGHFPYKVISFYGLPDRAHEGR